MSHNPEAERTVLGALLVDNSAIVSANGLEPSDFYAEKNRKVFAALRRRLDRGDAADLVTLRADLGPDLDTAYLASLMDGIPRMGNVGEWARIIRSHALRRQFAKLAGRMAEAAAKEDEEPEALIERGIGALIQLARRANPEGFLDNRKLAKAALEEIEAQASAPHGILGLRTGLIDLDRKLQGIRAGQLGLICARLKSGKSILCSQIADRVAKDTGQRVAFFSREMSGKAITKRRLSAEAKVAVSTLYSADKATLDRRMGRLAQAFQWVAGDNVLINTSADTVPQMRALSQQLRAEHSLAMIVVDYLQLVRGTEKQERRHLEIAEITRELKRLAIDLEAPVLAAVQLNRGPESRSDKRPYISDAADSDSIGRDCDWAVLIHREPPPPKGAPPDSNSGLADLILDVNRDGHVGTARVRFNAHVQKFETLTCKEIV